MKSRSFMEKRMVEAALGERLAVAFEVVRRTGGKDTPGPNVALAETLPWHAWPPGVQTIATTAVRR